MSLLTRRPSVPNDRVLRVVADLLTGDSVREAVRLPGESSGARLHLDLSGVHIPTAGGLGSLIGLHKELRACGGRLVLLNVQPWAFEVFSVTRLTELLDVRAA